MNVFDAYLQDKPSAFYKFDHTGTSFPNQMGDSRALTCTSALSTAQNTPIVTGSAAPVLAGGTNVPKIPSDILSSTSKKSPVSLECWAVPRLVGPPTQPAEATVTNMVPNPSARTVSGMTVVRENLATNPSLETNSAGWGSRWFGSGAPAGTSARTAGAGVDGSYGWRKTFAASTSSGDIGLQYTIDPVVPGKQISGSVAFRANCAGNAIAFWAFIDSTGTVIPGTTAAGSTASVADAPRTAYVANQWVRLSRSGVVPAGAVKANLVFGQWDPNGNIVNGTTFDGDQVLIETAPTVLGPYFDGSTPAAGDFTYIWSGTANASTSRQLAPTLVGWSYGGASPRTIVQGHLPDGRTAVGIWPTSGSDNAAVIGGDTGGMRAGLEAGKSYTVSATAYTPQVSADPTAVGRRFIQVYWRSGSGDSYHSVSSASAPNVGEGRVSLGFTIPSTATEAFIRFRNGSGIPGEVVYWTEVILTEGTYTGGYFDGSVKQTNNYRYAWSGVADNSVSYRYSPGPVGIFSHKDSLDGIAFDGEKINFSIKFQNEPAAVASWYVPDYLSKYHIVGVFSGQKVSLFIDGVMVSEADLTEAQMSDEIVTPSDSYLYLGTSSTSEVILIDAPAIYEYTLSSSSIVNHFIAGATSRGVVDNVMSFGGRAWTFDDFDRNIAMSSDVELSSGLFSSATYLDGVRPTIDDTLTSEAGAWTTSIPVAATGLSTIDGVKISWEGDGYFTVTASFDLGSTWTAPLENGQLIPGTVGMDPTGKEIDIKVAFVGGIVNDISVIRELSYVVYPDSIIKSDNSTRTVTLNGDISTASILSQPLDSYQNAGLRIPAGDTATIDPDTSDDPQDIQTIEILFNVESIDDGEIVDGLSIVSGAFEFTDTVYFNGSSIAPTPVANQWFHVVIVGPANNNSVTIGGGSQMNVAMTAVYKDALSADQVTRLYTSYFGNVTTTVTESSVLSVQESAQMYNLYDYDWQIISGGR